MTAVVGGNPSFGFIKDDIKGYWPAPLQDFPRGHLESWSE